MNVIDWIIFSLFLIVTVWDGLRRREQTEGINDFFLAGRSVPWWAAGISIMATHASAITFIGTTGQAYVENMRFLQVYLGIPFAMVILSVTLVPYYQRMGNFSAYEVLESRFGLRTRLTTSLLFLISRGLALGTVIAAPSYVLALLIGIRLDVTIMLIGVTATLYTSLGGMTGVIRTDIKQMAVMVFGLIFCFIWIVAGIPKEVSFSDVLYLAGTLDKLQALDLNFDLSEKYTIWSGALAGIFLMLSYFGCDQTQVQRYLTARSLEDASGSLLLSAFAKVPMQFFILLLGVFLYVFYIFAESPLTFRPVQGKANETHRVQGEKHHLAHVRIHQERRDTALLLVKNRLNKDAKRRFQVLNDEVTKLREKEFKRIEKLEGAQYNDTNYIVPYFILHELPVGVMGLIIAGIFAAALSSIDSTLNSLSTVSIVDWYKRLHKQPRSETHYLNASRSATFMWGVFATLGALALGETESIIELVNKIGSYFYGSILGVFILLLWFRRTTGSGAFYGLLAGMFSVFLGDCVYNNPETAEYALVLPGLTINVTDLHIVWSGIPQGFQKSIQYLWLNPLGAGVVVLTAGIITRLSRGRDLV